MSAEPFRVLVTGSRHATTAKHERTIYLAISEAIGHIKVSEMGRVVLVHGDATGVDQIAAHVVAQMAYPIQVEAHQADWRRLGKAAGTIRNRFMVSLGADVCLAFPLPGSIGTWDCARRAADAGIPTILRTLPGGPL